jgi:hypothetical protein
MKLTTALIILLIAASKVSAQDITDELKMIKSLFGNDKDFIVREFVKVEGVNKETFERLYAEFESARKEIGQKKYHALNNYVKTYNTLSEPELDEIMKEIIQLNVSHDKLIAVYYKKIRKQCGVGVAAQFYQIEWYLLSQIRTAILENIPTLNELDKK